MTEENRRAMAETPAMTDDERSMAYFNLNRFYGGEGNDYPTRLLMAVVNAYRAGRNSMRDPLTVKPNRGPDREADDSADMDDQLARYHEATAEKLLDDRGVMKPANDQPLHMAWRELVGHLIAARRRGIESMQQTCSNIAKEATKARQDMQERSEHLNKAIEALRLVQIFEGRLPAELRPHIKTGIEPDHDIPF
jgi:hypothetical protein